MDVSSSLRFFPASFSKRFALNLLPNFDRQMEIFLNQLEAQDKELIQLKREVRLKGGFYVRPQAKLLFIVRIPDLYQCRSESKQSQHEHASQLMVLTDIEVSVACMVLIGLFALQRYGTHRVGFLFAPVVITWFFCISAIGIYNIFYWNTCIKLFLLITCTNSSKKPNVAVGCPWAVSFSASHVIITPLIHVYICVHRILLNLPVSSVFPGSEAMFADLEHFFRLSI
ncbi:hypothetical protein ACP275_09G041100 [Erythranthe tilingii]